MTAGSARPDVGAVMQRLKDFQRDTVEYVFRRMFLDPVPTRRFLIADEVGLGKTLVARGVVARAVDRLWDEVKRIDVVYICSNRDIARQNVRRLGFGAGDEAEFQLASRITLMPVVLKDLKQRKLNFISFTPGTSFDLKGNLGWANERVLLYWLLQGAWGLEGTGPKNVLQGSVSRDRFRARLDEFQHREEVDPGLREEFVRALEQHDALLRQRGELGLRERFTDLSERFHYSRTEIPEEDWYLRREVVGDLRALLAATCIEALEPDLIILDEFQRFKNLLDGDDEAARLARVLFEYSGTDSRAHVLLLSATPYKMYTVVDEAEGDDHYADFIRTLRFLVDDPSESARLEGLLSSYREELLRLPQDGASRLLDIKRQLEAGLLRVMVRTERLAVSADRSGMLTDVPAPTLAVGLQEVKGYRALQRIARELEHPDTLEYWKSAPYLLNFMDRYKLKEEFRDACKRTGAAGSLARILADTQALLLQPDILREYRRIDPGNARMRWLTEDLIEREAWRLLWIPPSLPYYRPQGPFAQAGLRDLTKRLLFSSWHVAPKVVATLLSYEAERRMITSHESTALNTPEARARRRGLLRFSFSEGRPMGMPVLSLLYPCVALARLGDPLRFTGAAAGGDALPALQDLVGKVREALVPGLDAMRSRVADGRPVDESWYWAAPILLDLSLDTPATCEWWRDPDLESISEDGGAEDEDPGSEAGWARHLRRAREVLDGTSPLGQMPPDLPEVLALAAIAGPGVAALRALTRGAETAAAWNPFVRYHAVRVAWGFRSLFNLPESMALLRGMKLTEPYWRRVLEYCALGNLQSVLDEYAHVLRESLGLADVDLETAAEGLADAVTEALSLRTATIGYDEVSVGEANTITLQPQRLRARFALRFGGEDADEAGARTRSEQVRTAFNSPFWPFVLATTSVGQEGLDFHPYCHAVVHWNLPCNPVDLEQREGRVHRYKGHAVRKNVARQNVAVCGKATLTDPWTLLFQHAVGERAPSDNDLQPFWVYPLADGARIERHVPALPLSRDEQMFAALRRSLVVYRLVFGQPRQEDLLVYLLSRMPREEILLHLADLQVDLRPIRLADDPAGGNAVPSGGNPP